jgi:hypothetical protein
MPCRRASSREIRRRNQGNLQVKILKQTDCMKVSVNVSPFDEKYTKMQMVCFETQYYDEYNKVWLEARNFRVMMSPQEMISLAQHLVVMAGKS